MPTPAPVTTASPPENKRTMLVIARLKALLEQDEETRGLYDNTEGKGIREYPGNGSGNQLPIAYLFPAKMLPQFASSLSHTTGITLALVLRVADPKGADDFPARWKWFVNLVETFQEAIYHYRADPGDAGCRLWHKAEFPEQAGGVSIERETEQYLEAMIIFTLFAEKRNRDR